MPDDDAIIEAMTRDLCSRHGLDPDAIPASLRGSELPNWRHYEDECRNFLWMYRAMIKARYQEYDRAMTEASHEPQEAKETSGAIIDPKD